MNTITCANGCARPVYNQKRSLCEPCYRRVLGAIKAANRVEVEEKTCCQCGETKSASQFHQDKRRRDGLAGACKACKNAPKTARRRERQHRGRIWVESKECATCGRILSSDFFRTNNNRDDGYEKSCRECLSKQSPDDFAQWQLDRERDAALLALRMKFCRICKTAKPLEEFSKLHTSHDGYQYRCKECGRTQDAKRDLDKVAEYRHNNPEIYRDAARRRRAKQKNPDGVLVLVKRLVVAERDGWICQLCGDPIDPTATYKMPDGRHNNPEYLNIDHWIPLTKGGDHSYENCYASHARCNWDKKDKMPATAAPALGALA